MDCSHGYSVVGDITGQSNNWPMATSRSTTPLHRKSSGIRNIIPETRACRDKWMEKKSPVSKHRAEFFTVGLAYPD